MKKVMMILASLLGAQFCFGQFEIINSDLPKIPKEKKPKKEKTYEVYTPNVVVDDYQPRIVGMGTVWVESPIKGSVHHARNVKVRKGKNNTSENPNAVGIAIMDIGRTSIKYKLPLTVPNSQKIRSVEVEYWIGNGRGSVSISSMKLLKERRGFGDKLLDSKRPSNQNAGKVFLKSSNLVNYNDVYLEVHIQSSAPAQVIIENVKVHF